MRRAMAGPMPGHCRFGGYRFGRRRSLLLMTPPMIDLR